MNKFTKRTLHKQLALAGVLGVGTFALQNQANAAVTFYTADATKTSIFTVGLTQGSLGNGTLANPTSLTSGSTQFKYTAVNFTPTESGTYKFGQTYSVNDTVMILYDGVYNPLTPGTGALVGNDDTSAAIHQAALGSAVAVQCGPSVNYCPQVTYNVVAGMTYTLFVSVYSPSYNNTFTLPFDFYSTGDVIFNVYTGRSPIDLARSTYMSGELGVTVDPIFVGGTLHMNENNGVYAQDFTLSNIATNTIDQYNNYTTFNGKFTDGVAGVPGQITIINSGTDGEVTFNGINTYTGSTTLKGGTLAVSQDANLGDTAATLVFDGGKLHTTDSFNSARNVTLASTGTMSIDDNKTVSLSGIVSGAGSWVKDGAGVLVLDGNNTYTGSTTLKDGTLSVSQDANLGDTAATFILDSGTLLATDSFDSARDVTLASTGTISIDDSKTVGLSGVVSGAGSWIKEGTGVLALSGTNTNTGSSTIKSGTLSVSQDANLGDTAATLILDGGTLLATGSFDSARNVTLASTGTISVDDSKTVGLSGLVSGAGSWIKEGAGVLVLNTVNTYTGSTTIKDGTVSISQDTNLGDTATALILDGGTLLATDSFDSARNVTLASTGTISVDDSKTVGLSSVVSGTGSWTKDGAGVLVLNTDNSYTGSTTLKGGTLSVSQDSNLGDAAAVLILDGGTLLATDSFDSARDLTLASTGTINVESGKNLSLSGITSGSGSWTKDGAGVLVLNTENTYTGSTTLKDGTLSISQDSNLGDTAATLVFDGGTLLATNSFESSRNVNLVSTGTISVDGGKIVSLSNAVSGAGSWTKDGEGKLVLNADNSYTGSTNVASGTLVIGADSSYSGAVLSGGGDVSIADGATLGGYGSVTGNVANSGIIAVGSTIDETSTSPMANFTINGNYVGNDGTLLLNTVLGGDTAVTDKLMIAGDATGKTKVLINNLGGSGAKTINGLEVINVGGVSDNEAFVKEGRIVAGAYDYNLVKGNAAGTNTQSWFLASTDTTRPEAGGYLGLIEFNQGTFNHSFHDRQQLLDNEYKSSWARVEYTHGKSKVGADNELSNKTNRTLIHFGSDVYSKDALHLGVMGGYSKGDIDTSSSRSRDTTSSDSDGYSAGVYGTWFDQGNDKGGLYVDSYAQYNWFSNTLQGSQLDTEKFNTKGATISAEAGYGIALGKTNSMSWMIEPQVQVIYNSYDGKDHTEQNGTRIRTSGSDDVIGRVGVRLQGKSETVQPFVTLNYWTHSDQASISMNDMDVSSSRAKNVAELKVGGQVKVNKNVDLFGQLQASAGSHSTSSYGGNVGVKVNW